MKKMLMAFAAVALMMLSACDAGGEAAVVCGREWNPGANSVADTTSEFGMGDPMLVQLRYGKNFDFTSLKVAFYDGTLAAKGKELWSHEVKVTTKMGEYTLQGKSKQGGLMSAREITRMKKPGTIVVEFSTGDRIIASKEVTLVQR